MLGRKKYRKNKKYHVMIAAMDLRATNRVMTYRERVWFNQHTSETDAVDIMVQRLCDSTGDVTLTPRDTMVTFYRLVKE